MANIEFFVARRLSEGRRGVMTVIATVTTAVSVAVMIVALAVIGGFRSEITARLTGFGAHVQIVNPESGTSLETLPIARNPQLESMLRAVEGVRHVYPYGLKGGIVKTDRAMQGVVLKGVEAGWDSAFFRSVLVEGRLPRVGAPGDTLRTKDLLVSLTLARTLALGVDDRVEMLFVHEGRAPRRDRFRVSGIYDSGLVEMEMMVTLTDMRNVQRLSGWDSTQVTGYEITGRSLDDLTRLTDRVCEVVSEVSPDQSLMVVDIAQRFPNLFDWLRAHNVNAAVVIVIMVLVALLNMVSALLIIVLRSTRTIGVLKALGMNNRAVQRVFILRSGGILLRGMAWGNAVGLAVCLAQKYTGLVRLQAEGYVLSYVPISLDWMWLVALNVGVFALLLLLLVLPTGIISRISPDTSIRYS